MAQHNENLVAYLASPDDQKELQTQENHLFCPDLDLMYPNIRGIPWLFKDPSASLLQWQAKTQMTVNQLNYSIQSTKSSMPAKGLNKKTKQRMKKMIEAETQNLDVLKIALSPLFAYKLDQLSAVQSLKSRVGATQDIFSYENTLFRDWAFHDQSYTANHDALDFILKGMPKDLKLESFLVLGPGACRLPIDLARNLNPEITIAADINPFLTLIAQKLLAGETVKYYEIPGAPTGFETSAVERVLKMTDIAPNNFHFVLTDALGLPFRSQAMSLILTPWFIDIIHQDLAKFLQGLNRCVKEGGYWMSFGPLLFDHRGYEGRYTFDEIKIIAEKNGFHIENHQSKVMPYLNSDASAHRRSDLLHLIVAQKVKEVSPPSKKENYLPPWILDPTIPVPREDYLARKAASMCLMHQIFSQVDGQKSLGDMTTVLRENYGMDESQALQAILGVFTEVYEENISTKYRGISS